MKKANTKLAELGRCIKLVRESRGLKQEYISTKLGYKDRSTYAKLERGELESIDFFKLIEICRLLNCSLLHLALLANIDLMNGTITRWDDFFGSLKNLPEDERSSIERMVDEKRAQ